MFQVWERFIIKFLNNKATTKTSKQKVTCEGCCRLVILRTSLTCNNTCDTNKTTLFYVICAW